MISPGKLLFHRQNKWDVPNRGNSHIITRYPQHLIIMIHNNSILPNMPRTLPVEPDSLHHEPATQTRSPSLFTP
jgi:hypothetical protein